MRSLRRLPRYALLRQRSYIAAAPPDADLRPPVAGGARICGRCCSSTPPYAQGAFVSKHYRTRENEVQDFLQSRNIASREANRDFVSVRECIFCPKPHNNDPSNLYKLNVHKHSGSYRCFRCDATGNWFSLKMAFNGNHEAPSAQSLGGMVDGSRGVQRTSASAQHAQMAAARAESGQFALQPIPNPSRCKRANIALHAEDNSAARRYLTEERGLSLDTVSLYGVGVATHKFATKKGFEEQSCLTFPWIMREREWTALQHNVAPPAVLKQRTKRLAGANAPPSAALRRDAAALLEENAALMRRAAAEEAEGEGEGSGGEEGGEGEAEEAEESGDAWVTVRLKARSLLQKGNQRLEPKGGGYGLFGWHTVPEEATCVVLTEGEFDAMAVYQSTGVPAVSLPTGCRNLPPQVLPLLERFETIFLWTDFDGPGREGAEKFTRKLGEHRVRVVGALPGTPPGVKDANDCLRDASVDTMELLRAAKPLRHAEVATFSDYRDDVLDLLRNPESYAGVPVGSLPGLNRLLKGFRSGEMTILSGPTGSGKTTLLTQLSLDLANAGVNTLWGSFEVRNTRLIRKMLQQFAACSFEELRDLPPERMEALMERFGDMPLFFLRFHGGTPLEQELDAMQYVVYVEDVDHIILDNLQFMLPTEQRRSNLTQFDVQDNAIAAFRRFATEHNVHITLVIHPRKEGDGQRLGINSIFGSAKATQEADNVIILQQEADGRKFVELKKNRYDGETGEVRVVYNKSTGVLSEPL